MPVATLRQQLKRESYTGECLECSNKKVAAGLTRWVKASPNKGKKWITKTGYVCMASGSVSDEDLPLFKALVGSTGHALEHRWVISKFLGRPLTPRECVDHMDGVKTNNNIENLRLYVRGKQEAGSCPGHGTYYHEWQTAQRRITELERLIEMLRKHRDNHGS